MIRTVIVDDEPLAVEGIEICLRRHPEFTVIGNADRVTDAIELLNRAKPDLLFLDIQMPRADGFDLLRSSALRWRPWTVFLTAHSSHALKAFEAHALDYLLKPIDDYRFDEAVRRVKSIIASTATAISGRAKETSGETKIPRFLVRSGTRTRMIDLREIDWIEAIGDYAGLHVGSRTHMLRESMSSLEERLEPFAFMRIHRSAMVQLDRVGQIRRLQNCDYEVTLKSGEAIRVSRTFSKRLWAWLGTEARV
jgi:two-component system LytT family response regulator